MTRWDSLWRRWPAAWPPTLRETLRNDEGPYRHEGSLPMLAAVLEHYERGVVERPTLPPELPRPGCG